MFLTSVVIVLVSSLVRALVLSSNPILQTWGKGHLLPYFLRWWDNEAVIPLNCLHLSADFLMAVVRTKCQVWRSVSSASKRSVCLWDRWQRLAVSRPARSSFPSLVSGIISPSLLLVEVSSDEAAFRNLYSVECQHPVAGAITVDDNDDPVLRCYLDFDVLRVVHVSPAFNDIQIVSKVIHLYLCLVNH